MANDLKTNSAVKIVSTFIDALNREDFETARNCLSDDMKFIGVLGTRDGADVYIADMKKMKLKYDIQKAFSDENDVCLFYDITMSGKKIFSCGWYAVESNKIKLFKVIFDPRPLL
ncbi:MAG TPA: nuclear transport factor 2 family protein [Parafilimonas sp.]|jgi:limonene-1,2-epoxide hydrolase